MKKLVSVVRTNRLCEMWSYALSLFVACAVRQSDVTSVGNILVEVIGT